MSNIEQESYTTYKDWIDTPELNDDNHSENTGEDIVYEGVPSQPFDRLMINGNRFYVIDGNLYIPSVTTILKCVSQDGINAWRKRIGHEQANIISNSAAQRGTIMHEICEIYIKNQHQIQLKQVTLNSTATQACEESGSFDEHISILPHITPSFVDEIRSKDLCTYFNHAFLPMLARISNVKYQEVQLYSRTHKFAGTVDCIADFDQVPSVIDFKTSSKPKLKKYISSYFLQTAAYSIAYRELTGINLENLVILIGVHPNTHQVYIENINNIYPATGLSWRESLIQLANKSVLQYNNSS